MNRPLLSTFLAAAVLAVAVPAPARAQEPVAVRRALDPDAYVKVWNEGGSVRIVGWALDSLAVTGEVRAGSGRFFIGRQGDAVVKLGLEGSPGSGQADLVVRVPATATVWVRTAGADIGVRGLTGSIDLHSVSGAIDVVGRLEHLYAESMGGDLRLDLTAETARAKAGTGRIEFRGTAEDLTLSTVSGGLWIDAPALRRGRFSTVDGDVRFRGGVQRAGSIAFETHGGDVALWLPPELEAAFALSTFEGRIAAEFGNRTATPGAGGPRTLSFETGAGESEVSVRTFSGSITVRKMERVTPAAASTPQVR